MIELASMDLAYDHIQEEAFRRDTPKPGEQSSSQPPPSSLNDEIQDAYKAFYSSPWGAKIGGFFGNMVKQVRLPRHCAARQGQKAVLTDPGRIRIQPGFQGAGRSGRGRQQGTRRPTRNNHKPDPGHVDKCHR